MRESHEKQKLMHALQLKIQVSAKKKYRRSDIRETYDGLINLLGSPRKTEIGLLP